MTTSKELIENAREAYKQYLNNFDGVCAIHINGCWENAVIVLEIEKELLQKEINRLKDLYE